MSTNLWFVSPEHKHVKLIFLVLTQVQCGIMGAGLYAFPMVNELILKQTINMSSDLLSFLGGVILGTQVHSFSFSIIFFRRTK